MVWIGAAEIQAEAETADERLALVGDPVVVGVAQRGQERRMHDIQRVAVEHDTARAVCDRREDRVLVGAAVAVGIHEPQNRAHARILLQRSVPIDADESRRRSSP